MLGVSCGVCWSCCLGVPAAGCLLTCALKLTATALRMAFQRSSAAAVNRLGCIHKTAPQQHTCLSVPPTNIDNCVLHSWKPLFTPCLQLQPYSDCDGAETKFFLPKCVESCKQRLANLQKTRPTPTDNTAKPASHFACVNCIPPVRGGHTSC
jgi:hypothetical protein